MKKIIMVNSRLSNGGSERVMTILANQFAKNKEYDVHMILLRESNDNVYEVNNRVKLHQFSYNTNNKIIKAIRRYKMLKNFLKNEKPDIVISFMIDINILTLLSGRSMRNKIIVSERADPQSKERNIIHRHLEKKLYPKCKKVVLQTNDVKKYYTKNKVYNTVVIPNPISGEIPKPNYGKRNQTIVSAGRMTSQKNFKLLIDGFSRIAERYSNYNLVIYGQGPLLNRLKEQASEYGLDKRIIFPGFVRDVDNKINEASIYVSTSNYEGISNSMMEALAMGVPTICTDCPVGGAAMMIENNVNGILIPMNDVDALYNAMTKILDNKDFSDKISKEAIKIKDKYSVEKIVKEWEKLL